MFEKCRGWRKKLSRRADGDLPEAQWGALDNHLAHCEDCRDSDAADSILRAVLQSNPGRMDEAAAHAFDNQVVNAWRAEQTRVSPIWSALRQLRKQGTARWNALPFDFFSQIAGGALAASAITAICLLTALRPIGNTPSPAERSPRLPAAAQSSEPPVPLESLLNNASPRAALLWSTPTEGRSGQTRHAKAARPRKSAPSNHQRSALDTSAQIS